MRTPQYGRKDTMARHSFIQMSKLPNVKGRISYITSKAKQENLYATYRTADNTFWNDLARESQQEFKRSGTTGKCIEARELIIALPEVYTTYEPQQVLEDFTEEFRRRYNVECVSALHHNKRKTNYHIHLIFSERTLLPEPNVKVATRSVFFDETGQRVRTKKEIIGEDGQIRKGCTVIKKGEVYESHLFATKDERFKSEPFLEEVKQVYTAHINRHIADPEQQLKVFDKNGVYLPTKKIGKNNPREEEIKADNAARQEWNRTADMALITGISEETILEVKLTQIHEKVSQSIRDSGWLPNLFRSIVSRAKDFLQNLIREKDMPPKPTLDIDISEVRHMRSLMVKVQDRAKEIKHLQDKVLPGLKQQLAETKGIFKAKERKALEAQIQQTKREIADKLDKIPDTLKADGYPDVQAFMDTFRKMEGVVEQYNRDLAKWEWQVQEKGKPQRPPEKESVRDRLRQLRAEGKQQRTRKKSQDRER
ncbi:MAG: MobA/MobL family protein [Acutalibacteraceae bacterium]